MDMRKFQKLVLKYKKWIKSMGGNVGYLLHSKATHENEGG